MIAPIFAHLALTVGGGLEAGHAHRALDRPRARARRRGHRRRGLRRSAAPARRRRTSIGSSPARRRPGTRRRCWRSFAAPRQAEATRARARHTPRSELPAETARRWSKSPDCDDPRRGRCHSGRNARRAGALRLRRLRAGEARDRRRPAGSSRAGARRSSCASGSRPMSASCPPTSCTSTPTRPPKFGRPPSDGRGTGRRWPSTRASGAQSAAIQAAPTWKGIVEVADERDCEPDRARLARSQRTRRACCFGSVAAAVSGRCGRSVLIVHRRV